jgi:hypothetical protein
LSQVTEWTYRNLCIEIARNGFRTNEPEPMEWESSQLLSKVLDFLQSQKVGRADIAKALYISVDEINSLTFKLTRLSVVSGVSPLETIARKKANLRLV